MKPMTREWVDKAEADYAVALLARRSRKNLAGTSSASIYSNASKNIRRVALRKLAFPTRELTTSFICSILYCRLNRCG
jgi:hypothetical protein